MKVKELIRLLFNFDPEGEVFVSERNRSGITVVAKTVDPRDKSETYNTRFFAVTPLGIDDEDFG